MRKDRGTGVGKAIVALFLMGLTVAAWIFHDAPDNHGMLWAARLGGPVGVVIALLWAIYQPPTRTLEDELRALRPSLTNTCPFCALPIEPRFGARCTGCGVRQTMAATSRSK